VLGRPKQTLKPKQPADVLEERLRKVREEARATAAMLEKARGKKKLHASVLRNHWCMVPFLEDLNLFFEDITYHEMVQCSKAGCSENYQPVISRCQNCQAKLKSFFARKDWVPPVGKRKFVIDDMVSDHISEGLCEFK
jgi:hypothetical protein